MVFYKYATMLHVFYSEANYHLYIVHYYAILDNLENTGFKSLAKSFDIDKFLFSWAMATL